MEIKQNNDIICICNDKFDEKKFEKHIKECLLFKQNFSELDTIINQLIEKYTNNEKELNLVIYLFKKYITFMESKLKKYQNENLKYIEKEN